MTKLQEIGRKNEASKLNQMVSPDDVDRLLSIIYETWELVDKVIQLNLERKAPRQEVINLAKKLREQLTE